MQVAAQFPLGRWAIDDLYKLVREVHQIVERDARIDARGGQKLKESAVRFIRGIFVSTAAPPTAAQPRCAGHVQKLIPSLDIGRARAVVQFSPLAVLQRTPADEIELSRAGGNGGHKVSTVGADTNILMVCLAHRQRAVVCLRNSCAAVVIANGKQPPHEAVLPVGFCIGKVLQIHVQFGIAVHVEDALVGACSHCGDIPRALAVVGIDTIETTLRIGKAKVAHQPLPHPVGLQPCQSRILWFRLQPIEKFKASDTNILIVVEAITNVSLLEKRGRGIRIVAAADVITGAQA